MVRTKKYAVGKYNPDGSPKTKRQRVIIKPYMTKKRKQEKENRENKLVIVLILICTLTSLFTAFFDMKNSYRVEAKEKFSITEVTPESGKIKLEEVVEDLEVIETKVMEASAYSEYDSCHHPKVIDGVKKCLVASGKPAEIGMVATYAYPIGTRLLINGKVYTVEDRTATKWGYRIDIFQGYGEEGSAKAKKFGIQYLEVKVLK